MFSHVARVVDGAARPVLGGHGVFSDMLQFWQPLRQRYIIHICLVYCWHEPYGMWADRYVSILSTNNCNMAIYEQSISLFKSCSGAPLMLACAKRGVHRYVCTFYAAAGSLASFPFLWCVAWMDS